MRMTKIVLKKFLYFKIVLGFNSPECPFRQKMQSAKHVLRECQAHIRKKNRTREEDRKKAVFEKISWEEMLTQLKLAKKATQFMSSLGLIEPFKSVTLD